MFFSHILLSNFITSWQKFSEFVSNSRQHFLVFSASYDAH